MGGHKIVFKAKAAFAKIAEAKQLGATVPVEKDAASLTAEAVMRGGEAIPITLSVRLIDFYSS